MSPGTSSGGWGRKKTGASSFPARQSARVFSGPYRASQRRTSHSGYEYCTATKAARERPGSGSTGRLNTAQRPGRQGRTLRRSPGARRTNSTSRSMDLRRALTSPLARCWPRTWASDTVSLTAARAGIPSQKSN